MCVPSVNQKIFILQEKVFLYNMKIGRVCHSWDFTLNYHIVCGLNKNISGGKFSALK